MAGLARGRASEVRFVESRANAEREGGHELIDLARWLRSNTEGRPYSLRTVAAELAGYGYVTPSGRPYAAAAVASMLAS
jgi:hypothetical protein